MFAFWVMLAWVVGAFIEELLFRGYLLKGIADLLGFANAGLIAGVLFQGVLFGGLHWYQGTLGFLMAGMFALIYGVAYLVTGRNLWPLILVHGIWNSVNITRVFLSAAPGGN